MVVSLRLDLSAGVLALPARPSSPPPLDECHRLDELPDDAAEAREEEEGVFGRGVAFCRLARVGRRRRSLGPLARLPRPSSPPLPLPTLPTPPPGSRLLSGSNAASGCRRITRSPSPLAAWRRAKTASRSCSRSASFAFSLASALRATAWNSAFARAAGVGEGGSSANDTWRPCIS